MGTCWNPNCGIEITLKEGRTHCDSCGELLFYKCNSCNKEFKIENKETKKQLETCKLCGYFKCPHCGVCLWSCSKYTWEKEVLKILRPEVTQGNCPTILNKVRAIVKYFEEVKTNKDRLTCPNKVPITYAKTKIKSLLAKFEGFKVKNENDQSAFVLRMNELKELSIGSEKTVNNVRENGSYGQEYRDAFNLLVCLGKFEIQKRSKDINGEKVEWEVFVRCEKGACPNLSKEDLIINECHSCKPKKSYPLTMEYCPTCSPYQKGKHKGELRKLKKRLSDKDSCQLYRGSFDRKKDGKLD